MSTISSTGTLLKKIYRVYSSNLIERMQSSGFNDLRPSFLEVLIGVCDHEGVSIKKIGLLCGLKKQTMTSHLNELEKRKYLIRKPNIADKREQLVFLTDLGQRFKLSLQENISQLDEEFINKVGSVELERLRHSLNLVYQKISEAPGFSSSSSSSPSSPSTSSFLPSSSETRDSEQKSLFSS